MFQRFLAHAHSTPDARVPAHRRSRPPLCLARQAQHVRVVDVFLRVRQRHHQAVAARQFVVGERHAQFRQPRTQRVAAGMLPQHQPVRRHAHRFRRNHLIRQRILQDSVLVDARLVRERVRAHHGLVRRHRHARNLRQQWLVAQSSLSFSLVSA